MPDICMCNPDINCKQAQSCYRYRANPSRLQLYAELYEPHPNDPSIKCVSFMAIEGRKVAALERD